MYGFVKRVADIVAALFILTLSSPLLILVMIVLYVANRGKIWFIQPRPGRYGKVFNIIKFKTMTDKTDSAGNLLADDHRLTRVGRLIRTLSLDEIPQFVNVLKGEMSVVGPRPLLVEYLPLYSERQMMRHNVRPGITGWAQVNGRNAVNWQLRLEYDVWYTENVTFWLDLRILVLTFITVLSAQGIGSETTATMEKFNGN